jgi:hypothetical protein
MISLLTAFFDEAIPCFHGKHPKAKRKKIEAISKRVRRNYGNTTEKNEARTINTRKSMEKNAPKI